MHVSGRKIQNVQSVWKWIQKGKTIHRASQCPPGKDNWALSGLALLGFPSLCDVCPLPCPLEAGAVTAPLPGDGFVLVRPLLCQRRSGSVIFHYCCLSNVSILATFKSVCSPCHHWDLKKLSSSFPVQNLHEGLKSWENHRQREKPQISHLKKSGTFSYSSSRILISCAENFSFNVLKTSQHPWRP